MKKLALLALGFLPAIAIAESANYSIDKAKSAFTFSILNKPPKATEFGPVEGKFTDFSGKIVFDSAAPEKSAVEITIQAASIDTANKKRDDHLRNPDFFDVKNHPTLSFKSTSIKKVDDSTFEVTGDFTMLGKTKPVTVKFKKSGAHEGSTEFQIKRSEWGMNYRVPDTADEVDIKLSVVGSKS